jgi:hypothetical protein
MILGLPSAKGDYYYASRSLCYLDEERWLAAALVPADRIQ